MTGDMMAGAELDRLVAERVMGWDPPIEYGIRYKDGSESWGQSAEYTIQKFNNYQRQGIAESLLQRPDLGGWSPSTNIAHAWEVVGKLRELFFRPILTPDWGTQWQCTIYRRGDRVNFPAPFFDSAPMAICHAALAALGVVGREW